MFQRAFKTIIVGVDFSTYSKVVVNQARLLSQLWKARLVLVHAIHDPVEYSPSLYMSFPNLISEKSYEERIKKFYGVKSAAVKVLAHRGTPAALLMETAGKYAKPLILAGHKGQSKMADFFFGSTAQILAMKSGVPVWIHRGNKVIQPHRILIAHDLSDEANHSIDIVKQLELASPLTYEVFYVKEKAFPVLDYKTYLDLDRRLLQESQRKIGNIMKSYPHLPMVTANGEITEKIAKRTGKFDLLVMTHHHQPKFFSKSETAEMLRKIKTPMLVTS